jgi:hypothetical protein
MDGVSLHGKMDKSTKASFQTISVMVLVNISIQMVNWANIFGKMVILIIVYKTRYRSQKQNRNHLDNKEKIKRLLKSE